MKNILLIGLTTLIFYSNQLKSQTDSLLYEMTPDSFPTFVYGSENFGRFVAYNLVYPLEAKTKSIIQGKVYISFVVDSFGKIFYPTLLKDIGGGCGQEAIRVIKLTSGLWTPGLHKGKKANVKMTIPIKFTCTNCTPIEEGGDTYEVKPTSDFYYNIGVKELQANRFLIAIYYFDRTLELNPKDLDATYNRAISKLKSNNIKGACEDFYKAQSLGDKESTELINKYCK